MKRHSTLFTKWGVILLLFVFMLACSSCQYEDHEESEPAPSDLPTSLESATAFPADSAHELVWKIISPDGDPSFVDPFKAKWEANLNALLREKGVSYTVRLEGFAYTEQREEMDMLKKQADIITVSTVPGTGRNPYQYYSREGVFSSLSPLLPSEWGNILQQAMEDEDLELAKVDGEIFALSAVLPALFSTAYDQSVLEENGISIENIDPVLLNNEEMLFKLKEISDCVPIVTPCIGDVFDLGQYVLQPSNVVSLGTSGRFENIYDSELFRNHVKKMLSLKEKHLLKIGAPDSKTLVYLPFRESFTREAYTDCFSFEEGGQVIQKEVAVVPDTSRPVIQLYWGDWKTGIASASEKTAEAEDFLLRLFTDPDIANLIQYGSRNEDYSINNQGALIAKSEPSIVSLFGSFFTNPLITYSAPNMAKDKSEYQGWFFEEYVKDFPYGFRFDSSAVMEEIAACTQIIMQKENVDMPSTSTYQRITALEITDVDAEIDQLVLELKKAGIEKIIQEANRQLGEWKEKN